MTRSPRTRPGATYIGNKMINRPPDTIFEIGGQDSKFISIQDGIVVDFTMNEACAAGTGSFLEEQAERMGIEIKGEFSDLALVLHRPYPSGRALHGIHGEGHHSVSPARRVQEGSDRRASRTRSPTTT